MSYIIGIDASRNRSGGARAHIIGIINALNGESPKEVKEIHIWSYKGLLNILPDYPWLKKHTHPDLDKGLFSQIAWQYKKLPIEAKNAGVDIMLNTDAGTFCRFTPSVTMSRDMLSYEPGEMKRFGFSLQRLRLLILKYAQNYSLKHSTAAIFLTKYAAEVIQKSAGNIDHFKIINHGISDNFRGKEKLWKNEERKQQEISCIYVSNVAPYKHQIHVARAIEHLRNTKGINIKIVFVGGGEGKPQEQLEDFIKNNDPEKSFLNQLEFIKHQDLPDIIAKSDLFIFASSCENMPNTLIEGMCSGLPIVCSNRGPMPEVLRDGGSYFDPEDYISISNAIELTITNEELRHQNVLKSYSYSKNFSWKKCSEETFGFLIETLKKYKNEK